MIGWAPTGHYDRDFFEKPIMIIGGPKGAQSLWSNKWTAPYIYDQSGATIT